MTRAARVALLAVLAAVAVSGTTAFLLAERRAAGWPDQHPHSGSVDGTPVIQALPPDESAFYAALLWLAPVFLAAAAASALTGAGPRLVALLARRRRAVVGLAAAAAVAAAFLVGHLVLERTPISDDEEAYLFHARLVASGRLAAAAPDGAPHYQNVFIVVEEGRWYSQYPIGNAALLAVGVLVGDPWAVPPLLAGLTVLLLAAIARELAGDLAAAVTALLAAASPFLACLGGTLLSHVACLACLALFLWAGLRASRPRATLPWSAAAAVAFGLAVYVRPSSALVVGLPLFALLWQRSGACPDRWRRRLVFAAVGLVMVAGQLWINHAITGHPLVSGYVAYWAPIAGLRSPLGFGRFPWGIHHTPTAALGNLVHNGLRLNAWLLGSPLSLALPLVALAAGRRLGAARWWLAAAGLAPFAVYFFYFWPGLSDVGPVLYAEAMLPWLVLAGAAAAARGPRLAAAVAGVALTTAVLAPLTFLRVQLPALAAIAADARTPLVAAAAIPAEERALVFCAEHLRPGRQGSWMAGRPNPWPDLRDRVLFVLSRGPAQDRHFWRRIHPERTAYYLQFEPTTGFGLAPLPPLE